MNAAASSAQLPFADSAIVSSGIMAVKNSFVRYVVLAAIEIKPENLRSSISRFSLNSPEIRSHNGHA